MDVKNLSQDQLDELKSAYLYTVENAYFNSLEIPNDVIYQHFDDINFVDDDFCCTANM